MKQEIWCEQELESTICTDNMREKNGINKNKNKINIDYSNKSSLVLQCFTFFSPISLPYNRVDRMYDHL